MTLNRLARRLGASAAALALAASAQATPAPAPHNVIIFVADGLRSHIVRPDTAPALAAVRRQGVDFRNSHSIYPTITTPNASVIATGHFVGDTGDFGNSLYVGAPIAPSGVTVAALEDDAMLGLMNQRFDGDYLGETSLLQSARAHGFSTAAIGKLGPTAIQDVTARDGTGSIVIDDSTGHPGKGVAVAPEVLAQIQAAGLPTVAPGRGDNGRQGTFRERGTQIANVVQQNWFVAVATKVVLPRFKAEGRPFVMVFWSRDPDGSQHNQGDSLNTLTPGINGPTTMAAIRNASDDLAALRAELKALGLDKTTDIVVTADHGFSTTSKQSRTSTAAKLRYPDVVPGFLPPGFLGIDLAEALKLPMADPNGAPVDYRHGAYSKRGEMLGADPAHPQVVVAPNGGTDLIYLPGANARALARRIVSFLTTQDYAAAIFVRDDLGPIAGALPTSAVMMAGSARTPRPAIIVGFRNFSAGCADQEVCGVEVADTDLQQGQGIHGSLGRQDTHNFMAAIGPDFRSHWVDPAPVSNADLAITLSHVLRLDLGGHGHTGRVLAEALPAEAAAAPPVRKITLRSQAAANGFVTVLNRQLAGGEAYTDAAGAPGRTIGLEAGAGRP